MCDVSCGTMEVAVESYFKCVMCPVVQITFKLSSTKYQVNDNTILVNIPLGSWSSII